MSSFILPPHLTLPPSEWACLLHYSSCAQRTSALTLLALFFVSFRFDWAPPSSLPDLESTTEQPHTRTAIQGSDSCLDRQYQVCHSFLLSGSGLSPLPCLDEGQKRNHQKRWIINHGDTNQQLPPPFSQLVHFHQPD